MKQDEICDIAKQAGIENDWSFDFKLRLVAFAHLVAAKEREACAKVAEHSFGVIGSTIALAIRARGEQA